MEFAFDPLLNKYGYKSKLHEGIIPSEVKLAGKDIHVHENVLYTKLCSSSTETANTPVKVPTQYEMDYDDENSVDSDISI